MNTAYFLRKFFLVRTSSSQAKEEFNKVSINQEEATLKSIADMIGITKTLLDKATSIKQALEHAKQTAKPKEIDQLINSFKNMQNKIQSELVFNRQLNSQMAGPFTFRLCKQLNYWRFVLPFVVDIIGDIQKIFERQKVEQKLCIQSIFYFTLKKVMMKSNETIKNLYISIYSHEIPKKEEVHLENITEIQKCNLREMEKERTANKKKTMTNQMTSWIDKYYYGLDVKCMQPISQYCCDLSNEDNLDILLKQQKQRNKKMQKEIKAYSISFQQLLNRRFQFDSYNRFERGMKKFLSINKETHQHERSIFGKKIKINNRSETSSPAHFSFVPFSEINKKLPRLKNVTSIKSSNSLSLKKSKSKSKKSNFKLKMVNLKGNIQRKPLRIV